jgi:hypothetical protein
MIGPVAHLLVRFACLFSRLLLLLNELMYISARFYQEMYPYGVNASFVHRFPRIYNLLQKLMSKSTYSSFQSSASAVDLMASVSRTGRTNNYFLRTRYWDGLAS